MTPFERTVYGFRFVETRRGDTLQVLAARELGDAGRWPEIIAYNELVPPWLTDDPARAGPGVMLTGSVLRVPAPAQVATAEADPDAVFEVDLLLSGGRLVADGGDIAVVAGRDNLRQAIGHRLDTEAGELLFHQDYGSRVRQLVGATNGPTAALLAARYARGAVAGDPRIQRITEATAAADGDSINVTLVAEPIVGRPIQIETRI